MDSLDTVHDLKELLLFSNMPISEDEFDHHLPHRPQHHVGMSKAEQRRSNKPIMEKRRRARINHCLNELKTLILDAMKKDPARHSKLEKADILEMTVKHLQTIQRQQLAVAVATDPGVLHKFKNGFNECATEVSRYIGRIEGVEPGIKQRLVSHLTSCVTSLQQLSPFIFPPPTTSTVFPTTTLHIQPTVTAPASTTTALPNILPQIPTSASVTPGDVNNNTPSARLQMTGGLQLIPSRLPTGELALLVPNSGQLPGNVLPFFPPPPPNTAATTGTVVTSSNSTNSSVTSSSTTSIPPPVPTSSTSTTIVADRSHPSAFTAVVGARSQSPTTTTTITTTAQILQQQQQHQHQHQPQPVAVMQNLSANKMMTVLTSSTPPPLSTSPASSVSSCETADTYGPSTPPPQSAQTYSTFSSSLGQFKVPLGSPSSSTGFKVFHFPILDAQKPHQQPLVTSSTSPPDITAKFEPIDLLAHNSASLQYQQPVSATSAGGVVAAELKLALKTLPTFEQSSPKLLTSVSQPVMNTVSAFQSHADSHPTFTSAATTTVSGTTAAATATFILPDQLQLSNPPLDFSIKKEALTLNTAMHSSASVSGKRTFPEAGNSAACSPSKMLRLSFVQSPPPQQTLPPLHKPETDGAPVGLLKLYSPPPPSVNPKCTSQLSVVVEDLSSKPSSSSEVPTNSAASAQSQGSKDMWRPW